MKLEYEFVFDFISQINQNVYKNIKSINEN